MSNGQLVMLGIKASIMLLVFGIGLHASWRDAIYLLGRTGLMLRSLLSMAVIMPLFAALLAGLFDLHPAVQITIIALAIAPVPPVLPNKQEKAGGTPSYAISLLVMSALFSIVVVPLDVQLMGWIFAKDTHIDTHAVTMIVLATILVPLSVGLAVNRVAPALAQRVVGPVSLFATILLVTAVLPVLFTSWPAVMSMIGNGTLLSLMFFTVFGLAVGHWLGGHEEDNRTILALATAARHPAVALAVAGANYEQQQAVFAVVLLHLIVGGLVAFPYVLWRKRRHATAGISA